MTEAVLFAELDDDAVARDDPLTVTVALDEDVESGVAETESDVDAHTEPVRESMPVRLEAPDALTVLLDDAVVLPDSDGIALSHADTELEADDDETRDAEFAALPE